MATRSLVALEQGHDSWLSIYCHWDGDLVGDELRKNYNSMDLAETIIVAGDHSEIVNKRKLMDDGCSASFSTSSSGLRAYACELGCEYLHSFTAADGWVSERV